MIEPNFRIINMLLAVLTVVVVASYHAHLDLERNVSSSSTHLTGFSHRLPCENNRANMTEHCAFHFRYLLRHNLGIFHRIEIGNLLLK